MIKITIFYREKGMSPTFLPDQPHLVAAEKTYAPYKDDPLVRYICVCSYDTKPWSCSPEMSFTLEQDANGKWRIKDRLV